MKQNRETVNPYNTSLTAGGSSGGEGALVGLRGSVLGIGSDIGGSIRSPAANCGVFGFKPTAGRLPLTGWAPLLSAAEHIVPTNGPLSTSLKGLELFMRVSLNGNGDGDGNGNDGVGAGSGKPWLREPNLVAMPWRDPASYFAADAREGGERRKLKVAVMWDDGVVKPHPPIAKALKDVVEKLKASENIEVVDWKPWRHDWAWEIIVRLPIDHSFFLPCRQSIIPLSLPAPISFKEKQNPCSLPLCFILLAGTRMVHPPTQ